MSESTDRMARCRFCRKWGEGQDMVNLAGPTHCWPCWSEFVGASDHWNAAEWIAPDGWYQRCERCEVRTWVTQERRLCPPCSRVTSKWRLTLVICARCGNLFRRSTKRNTMCCLPSTSALSALRAERMVAARARGTHTEQEWYEKVRASGYRCTYCKDVQMWPAKDHVVPVSRGGSDAIDNIVPACKPCNSSKGNKLLSEWVWIVKIQAP